MEQNVGSNNQANSAVLNGAFGNTQSQGMNAYNGMNFDPSTFQQMQQMMMQGGMNGMPNMNMMSKEPLNIHQIRRRKWLTLTQICQTWVT